MNSSPKVGERYRAAGFKAAWPLRTHPKERVCERSASTRSGCFASRRTKSSLSGTAPSRLGGSRLAKGSSSVWAPKERRVASSRCSGRWNVKRPRVPSRPRRAARWQSSHARSVRVVCVTAAT